MVITISIDTKNAAFVDGFQREMDRVSDYLAEMLPSEDPTSIDRKSMLDSYGNRMGLIEVSDTDYEAQ